MEEHSTLRKYRQKWIAQHVKYQGRTGVVIGVGDDGYMCEFDYRRRAKPNGTLFVRRDNSATVDKPLDFECRIINR